MALPEPLKEGDKAPTFSFIKKGTEISTADLETPYLVYFYPKDDTPGCTKQACGIRDTWAEFQAAGLEVIGISKDTDTSHEKFRQKYDLPFPLYADTDLTIANAFGVFGEKKFMGKIYDSVHRMSFLIAPDATILKTYTKVKPELHAKEILNDLNQLPQ